MSAFGIFCFGHIRVEWTNHVQTQYNYHVKNSEQAQKIVWRLPGII